MFDQRDFAELLNFLNPTLQLLNAAFKIM